MRTAEQAYDEYVAELNRYREWTEDRKTVYGQGAHPIYWGDADYAKIKQWNGELGMVRQILGLTHDEDMEADRRAGIKPTGLKEVTDQ